MAKHADARRKGERDKDKTKRALIAATGKVLARDGFARLGVNAVAAEAGADKVLIYRYFGGMEGLMEAYGRSGVFWPTVEEVIGEDVERLRAMAPGAAVAEVLERYGQALRARPVTLEILAWESVERNALTAILEDHRQKMGAALFERVYPEGADRALVTATLTFVAAIHYFAVRARKIRIFGHLEIKSEEGWDEMFQAMRTMLEQTYR